ncbi:MAG: Hsp20/alpha crystallin family protein [Reyranellaceae bacterium]
MADTNTLEVQEKKQVEPRGGEQTRPTRSFLPVTDIYETDQALVVVMEMPGVDRKDIDIRIEDDVLTVEGRIDYAKYEGMEPLYTEYGVGPFARSFSLSHVIDQQKIAGSVADGVLTLNLPKVQRAQPRRIEIS